jgi:hypothetical protein
MKKLILTFALLGFTLNSSAQDFSWGPKLSISSPSFKLQDVASIESGTDAIQLLKDTDPVLGYQIGVFARLSILGIYVQPEVLFSNAKSEVSYSVLLEEGSTETIVAEVKLNKIDIPVLFGKRFLRVFRINAGPVFTLPLNDNISLEGLEDAFEDVTTNYKKATVGAQIGVGLDISILTIDLRYEMGLQSISDGITIGETTFNPDQRLEQLMLSIGLTF